MIKINKKCKKGGGWLIRDGAINNPPFLFAFSLLFKQSQIVA